MYLIDTDVLIWILRGDQKIITKILNLKEKAPLAMSVMSIAEVYQNIFPSELVDAEELISQYIILDLDQKLAKMGGFYWQDYSKNLKNLSLADCLIAATANVNNATVVSLNTKHFPMTDIKVLKP